MRNSTLSTTACVLVLVLSCKIHADAPTIVYADIRTAASQCHLPAENTEVQNKNLTRCSYKIVSRVLILIIVLLCCALGYMVYFKELSKYDNEHWCDKVKQFCLETSSSPAGCQLCPYEWLPYEDHCYYYSDVTDRAWNQSRDHCKMMGADLLVIKNQKQQEFTQIILKQQTKSRYWIGLQCDGEDCRWLDGKYYDSSQLKTKSSDRCIVMTESGYYRDDCNSTYRWICLKKALKIDLS